MSGLLEKIKYVQVNSALARRLLALYYKEGRFYRILLGPLRGHRLYYDRSINFHAVLGLWDLEGFETLYKVLVKGKLLKKDMVIADVGGNIGIVSLWLSELMKGKGKIYAFEPMPQTMDLLKKNIFINRVTNIEPVELVCADSVGELEFFVGHHHHTSSLLESWASGESHKAEKITVKSTTLDVFFLGEGRRGPDLIKMDIEGGGIYALKGCDSCMEKYHPLVWIESHTPEEDRAISNLVMNHGYSAYRQNTKAWVTDPSSVHPNPAGIWGTMLLCPPELVAQVKSVLD